MFAKQESPSMIVDVLRSHARLHPTRVALSYLKDGETLTRQLTYAELDRCARSFAKQASRVVRPGDLALLLFESNLDFVIAFLGCMYANVTAVPAYPPRTGHHLKRLQALADDAKASAVMVAPSVKAHLGDRARTFLPNLGETPWLVLDTSGALADLELESWEPPSGDPAIPAFVQYTSGSTGDPKGVVVSHRNLMHNEQMVATAFDADPAAAVVSWLPLYHDMGLIGSLLQPLLHGSSCTLMSPASFIQRPVRWLRAITAASGRGVLSGGPNFAYELCLLKIPDRDLAGLDLGDWKVAFNGAEPVRADVIDAFSDRFASCGFHRGAFLPCYGMAEATLFISSSPSASDPVITEVDAEALTHGRYQPPAAGRPVQRLVSCGQAIGGQTLAAVHPETGASCAAGEVGELWLSGDSVAQGYWNRPALSEEVFRARRLDGEGDGRTYLRTGDLGFLLDGEVYVTGRLKDLIIVRGRNHYPQDLEATVSECSEVLVRNGCAAFAVPGRGGEELAIVQEVARVHRASFDAAQIVGQIHRALSEVHQLAVHQILLIDQAHLPRTSSGKIQRRACRDAMLTGTLRELHRWRGNEAADLELGLAPELDDATELEPAASAAEPPEAEAIERWLVERMTARLRLEVGAIDPKEPVAHYGLDSALAVSLTDELSRWLKLELEPTLFWEHPSIEQFSEHVSSMLRA